MVEEISLDEEMFEAIMQVVKLAVDPSLAFVMD